MTTVAERLLALGIDLPDAPKPVASYVPAVRTGNLIIVSGQIPMANGTLVATGIVPADVDRETASLCARQCALNAIAVLNDALHGDLDRVRRIVRLGVFVASTASFTDQPAVANGASDLLVEIFGDAGRHARAAVGAPSLPLNAPVEVEMMVEIE